MTDRAADCWSNFEKTEAKLYQCQMDHAARPSMLFNLRGSFNDFLKDANSSSEGEVPSSLEELTNKAGPVIDPLSVCFLVSL